VFRTAVIGIIPVLGEDSLPVSMPFARHFTFAKLGDFSDIALNYLLVVRLARKAEIPDWLVTKMLLNNGVSAALGFIPVAGA
jgi:hypothetical protein